MMNIIAEMARITLAQACPLPIDIEIADDWDHCDYDIERWENDGGRSLSTLLDPSHK